MEKELEKRIIALEKITKLHSRAISYIGLAVIIVNLILLLKKLFNS